MSHSLSNFQMLYEAQTLRTVRYEPADNLPQFAKFEGNAEHYHRAMRAYCELEEHYCGTVLVDDCKASLSMDNVTASRAQTLRSDLATLQNLGVAYGVEAHRYSTLIAKAVVK